MNEVRDATAEAAVQAAAGTKAAANGRRRRRKKGQSATPFREGKCWAVRLRVGGQRLYLSGSASEDEARSAL
jgi:hypothetical protein